MTKFLKQLTKTIVLLLVIGFFSVSLDQNISRVEATPPEIPFTGYHTHPNFWELKKQSGFIWVGKKYSLVPGSLNPGYDDYYVYSGAYGDDNYTRRYIFYHSFDGSVPLKVKEYEEWYGYDYGTAVVLRYGGITKDAAKTAYPNKSNCQNEVGAGVVWPNLNIGVNFAFTPQSLRYTDTEYCTDPYPNGDYIAVKMTEDWSWPFSFFRGHRCDQWIPYYQAPYTNTVCKLSPYVGVFQHRYVITKNSSDTQNPKYDHGCEMAIYAYGNPKNDLGNYKYWFRNGELRFTNYMSAEKLNYVKSPTDDSWWISKCTGDPIKTAWRAVPNWYYNGIYKITNTEYQDDAY